MIHKKRGSVSRIVLAVFILVAFCFALVWPQYAKHRNVSRLRHAADLGRALAFAESSYRQQHGEYTAQFGKLDLELKCPLMATPTIPVLDCPDYTFLLEAQGVIKASHKRLPVWLEVYIEQGEVKCLFDPAYENVGQMLCSRLYPY